MFVQIRLLRANRWIQPSWSGAAILNAAVTVVCCQTSDLRAGDSALGEAAYATKSATNGPLRVSSANPSYFCDRNGSVVFLTGSHTWGNFQDYTYAGAPSPPPMDFKAYLDFLTARKHSFFRLGAWESAFNRFDGGRTKVHTLADPAIVGYQEAYVRKVIDVVNDLDNVLYEISNEDTGGPADTEWQIHMIGFIRGNQCLFMDPYLDPSHDRGRNAPVGGRPDLYWEPLRAAMGRWPTVRGWRSSSSRRSPSPNEQDPQLVKENRWGAQEQWHGQ